MGSMMRLPEHCFKKPLPQRIAIVRALPGLGDLLCLVPALRALRSAFPQSEITLIGLPLAQSFVDRLGYLDRWLAFPGYPGIPEVPFSPSHLSNFLAAQPQFDWALQMHGNGSVMNLFVMALRARQNAGFFVPGQYCPNPDRFLPYPDDQPEVRRHLRLLEFLGIPLRGEEMEFPLSEGDRQAAAAIANAHALHSSYICVHPGASVGSRRWSVAQFAAVADALAEQGYQIVLTGIAAERELTQAVAQAMRHPAIDLAGKTDLGTIAALLQQARLLICNDTGISHLAAALRVKSVVIFSDSDLQRWMPIDRHRHRAVDCRNLATSANTSAAIAQVLAEATQLLQQDYAYAS